VSPIVSPRRLGADRTPRLALWWGHAVAEAQAFVTPGPRMIDGIECAASVLLAIVFGQMAGAHNISWAAFSGYMVMRGHVSDSLRRGVLRIVGTLAGALLAVALLRAGNPSPVLGAVALGAVGGVTLYASLTTRRAYAWLFVGLTFSMILLDHMAHPEEPFLPFAVTRLVEVTAGTAACVVVSMASTVSLRRRWPGPRRPDPNSAGWRPDAARHAGQGAMAMALVPLAGMVRPFAELSQAAVAIMAVMIVPVSGIGSSGFWPVTRRLGLRVAGCAAGGGLAAAVLGISHGSAAILIVGTVVGVMIGRHIENGESSIAYAGTQFTLAVLVALVPDHYASPNVKAGWARLVGTLVGIALLEPVLLAWHLLAPRLRASDARVGGEAGDI
jgi:uncharacterized membrane protein YccC